MDLEINDHILDYMKNLSEVFGHQILKHYGDIVEAIEEQEDPANTTVLDLLVLDQLCRLFGIPEDWQRSIDAIKDSPSDFHQKLQGAWNQLPHRLVEIHWGLVRQAAATYHRDSKVDNDQEFADLLGVAQEALYQAARKYMRQPKGDFKSFAWPLLRKRIKEEQGRKHPVPHKVRRKLGQLAELRDDYRHRQDPLTHEIIQQELKLNSSDLEELLRVEAFWGSGGDFDSDQVIEEVQEPDTAPDALQILLNIESEDALGEALSHLTDLEKDVIRRLYFHDMSIREAADVMDMSLSVFRKNHKRALKKLKMGVE